MDGYLEDVKRETTTASAISKPHRHLSHTSCIQPTRALGSDLSFILLGLDFPSATAIAVEALAWVDNVDDGAASAVPAEVG